MSTGSTEGPSGKTTEVWRSFSEWHQRRQRSAIANMANEVYNLVEAVRIWSNVKNSLGRILSEMLHWFS